MKISSIVAAACMTVAVSAFVPEQQAFVSSRHSPSTSLNAQSRSDFFQQVATTAAAAGMVLLVPTEPASAAKYGKLGAGSPEVLDPSQADVDLDILNSSAVQSALKQVKQYKDTVNKMQAMLSGDSQANLRPTILKELDVSALRQTLNTVNTAFEEDTQRGTDRLIRVILQDITELEQANSQKDGIERSPRRLENMKGKLAKLDKAFDDYLAFSK